MSWQTSYTISNDLKRLISVVCNGVLKNDPDNKASNTTRTSHITLNSNTWSFYNAEGITNIKEQLKTITGLSTMRLFSETYQHGYGSIWRYDKNFPKCPVHIDDEEKMNSTHKGSLCISVSGSHEIFLHDTITKKKIKSVVIKDNDIMFLNNREYYHSVEGNGDLCVIGVLR